MKVLYVIDSLAPGGAETSLAAMAPGLINSGVQLHVVHLNEVAPLTEQLEGAGARVEYLQAGGPTRSQRLRALSALIRTVRPDLVHTTLFEADVIGRLAATFTRTPVVSSIVNDMYGPAHAAEPGISPNRLRLAHLADLSTARLVRRFHAITHTVGSTMAQRLRIRPDKVEVVYRGRDPKALGVRSSDRRAAVRQTVGIPIDAPLVLAVGRHEPQKGHLDLIEAFRCVRTVAPGAHLLIAGKDGADSGRLRAAIGTDPQIRILGHRPDVPDLLASADVFAFPSHREGLGGAVIEAMGVGTPIVCSALAVLKEVCSSNNGCVAKLHPPGDRSLLAEQILDVLRSPTETVRRCQDGRQLFESRYTIDTASAGLQRIYSQVLNIRSRY